MQPREQYSSAQTIPPAQLRRLIFKLRWIGMDDVADELITQLGDEEIAVLPFETD